MNKLNNKCLLELLKLKLILMIPLVDLRLSLPKENLVLILFVKPSLKILELMLKKLLIVKHLKTSVQLVATIITELLIKLKELNVLKLVTF